MLKSVEHSKESMPSQGSNPGVTTVDKQKMKSVMAGMLLGDANLHVNRKGINAYLQLHHSENQLEYMNWKTSLFEGITSFHTGRNENIKSVWAHSKCVPFLTEMHEIAYPRGHKEVTERLLSYITPVGLAIWFMDDGSIREKMDDNGAVRGRDIRIYTCSFGDAEHDMLIAYFKEKWGIVWHKRPIRNKQGSYLYLGCGAKEAIKLFEIIAPHVVPSMRYKITFRPNKLRPNAWSLPMEAKRQSELCSDAKSAAEMPAPA